MCVKTQVGRVDVFAQCAGAALARWRTLRVRHAPPTSRGDTPSRVAPLSEPPRAHCRALRAESWFGAPTTPSRRWQSRAGERFDPLSIQWWANPRGTPCRCRRARVPSMCTDDRTVPTSIRGNGSSRLPGWPSPVDCSRRRPWPRTPGRCPSRSTRAGDAVSASTGPRSLPRLPGERGQNDVQRSSGPSTTRCSSRRSTTSRSRSRARTRA